jgi:hypothetical protein
MKRVTPFLIAALLGVVCTVLAGPNGGYIQGKVTLAKSVTSWEKVVVVICAEADPTCDKPTAVIKLTPAFPKARTAAYTSARLPAGKYAVYALNDKNDDVAHDPDTEELGGYFKEGTFEPLLVEPTKLGVDIEMIGF